MKSIANAQVEAYLLTSTGDEVAVRRAQDETLNCYWDDDVLGHIMPGLAVSDFSAFFERTTGKTVSRIQCM